MENKTLTTNNVTNIGKNNISMESTNNEINKPTAKFRAGGLSATVWKNTQKTKEGKDFSYYSISIDRNYTDKTGAWKSTNSMRAGDLPKAIVVIKKAYEFLVLKEQDGNEVVA